MEDKNLGPPLIHHSSFASNRFNANFTKKGIFMIKTYFKLALAFSSILLVLTGCMTIAYEPAIYKLGPERIRPLKVNGHVEYINSQTSKETNSIKDSSHTFNFDYQSVTEGFNKQLKNEIANRASFVDGKETKTLNSKVKHINCDKTFGSYVRPCVISVEIVTGAGETINVEAKQNASIFNQLPGALNGTIATGVIETLNNSNIRAYLEK
jgi:hypothetical protein